MSIKTRLSQALCISLLVFSSYGYAESLSLSLNDSSFTAGDILEVIVTANRDEFEETHADVYLAVQTPNGSLHYLNGLGLKFINPPNKIVRLATAWPIQTLPETTLLAFEVPRGLPPGTYKWELTLAKTGLEVSEVAQPKNWLVRVSVTLVLKSSYEEWPEFYEDEGIVTAGGEALEETSRWDTVDSADTVAFDGMSSSLPPSTSAGSADKTAGDSASSCCDDGDFGREPLPLSPSPFPDDNEMPVSGTLTAGDIDDNLNFAAFQRYMNKQLVDSSLPFVDMSDRVTLQIVDDQGLGVSNARVRVSLPQESVPRVDTYAGTDGRFYLFPTFDGVMGSQVDLQLAPPEDELGSPSSVFNTTLDLEQLAEDRSVTVTLPNAVAALPDSLEVMFVIDTTGSMGDELHYLVTELRDIIGAVQARHQQVRMRFGLVVYRDKRDTYVVRDFGFTDSLNDLQIQLSEQKARGGGDYPEAMAEGLAAALNKAQWREGNVARLLFLIADAPPHDENLKAMLEQVQIARQMGIRIYPLAASGVGDKAEFMMRNAGVLTQGRYLFLTDDSGVGSSHQEPSVSCYVVTHLNELMSRVIASELAGQRIEPADEYILRTVGHYEAGVCQESDIMPPPDQSTDKAQVENIRVQILESFPVQVRVVANGYFSDGCEKIDQINTDRDGNLFTVEITTRSEGEICTEAEVPFEEVIPLAVKGLKAGVYTVDVNGVTDRFELEISTTD